MHPALTAHPAQPASQELRATCGCGSAAAQLRPHVPTCTWTSPGAQRPGPWKPLPCPPAFRLRGHRWGDQRVGSWHLKVGTAGAGIRDARMHRGVLQRSSWGQEKTERWERERCSPRAPHPQDPASGPLGRNSTQQDPTPARPQVCWVFSGFHRTRPSLL